MLNEFVIKNGKKLRYGYTTGSCATAATKASLEMLMSGQVKETVSILTPKGWTLTLDVVDIEVHKDYVKCGIVKDSGDDPDVTHGITIYAKVSYNDLKDHHIYGGFGVGKVTKPGLSVAIGQSAINPTPMKTIRAELDKVQSQKCFDVEISIPEGMEKAKRTFNPKLGIVGGISVIGTSGIVEPMSEDAIKESMVIELKVLKATGTELLMLSPGNYGRDFARDHLNLKIDNLIKTSNYIGYILQAAVNLGFKKILWVGHLGKMVKVAGGIFNTHSRVADGRMETLTANIVELSDDIELARAVLKSNTTDEAIGYINEAEDMGLFNHLANKISRRCSEKVYDEVEIATLIFTNEHGYLGECDQYKRMREEFNE